MPTPVPLPKTRLRYLTYKDYSEKEMRRIESEILCDPFPSPVDVEYILNRGGDNARFAVTIPVLDLGSLTNPHFVIPLQPGEIVVWSQSRVFYFMNTFSAKVREYSVPGVEDIETGSYL